MLGRIARRILLVIAALVAIVLLSLGLGAAYANIGWQKQQDATEFSQNWMKYVRDDVLVKNVVMPGSHDAGTSTLLWLGRTQELTIADQLEVGTRYFDIRTERGEDGELYIYHSSLRGNLLRPMLESVRDFLKTHSTETVVLDFQHFSDKGNDETDVQSATLALVSELFYGSTSSTRMLVSATTGIDNKVNKVAYIDALRMSTARGKAIVFWGASGGDVFDNNYIFQRNDDEGSGTRTQSALHSFYLGNLNKKSSQKYIAEGLPTYIDMYKQKAGASGIFVLQGQLTDGLIVFGPQIREKSHNAKMNDYVKALETSDDLQYINVIMRDFVNAQKNMLAINLNLAKGNVKTSLTQDFTNGVASFAE